MKKNFIYGIIAAVVALVLLAGAVMSAPGQQGESVPTTQTPTGSASVAMSTAVPTVPPVESQSTIPSTIVPTEPSIHFLTWPEFIVPGDTGKVIIQGKPLTVYYIQVMYRSGPSGAKGLEEKLSDENGIVTWTWKVSKNASAGKFEIIVTDGVESVKVPFTVLE